MWRAWRLFPLGPLAGLALFWGTVVLGSVGVFGSIAWQLYGAPPAVAAHSRDAWCVARMASLSAELADRIHEQLQHDAAGAPQRQRWAQWQAAFRARLAAAQVPCAAVNAPRLAAAFTTLLRFTQSQEAALQQAVAGPEAARDALRAQLAAVLAAPRP